MFKRPDHIAIVVKDLEKAKQFFLDLSFQIERSGKMSGDTIGRIVNLENVSAEFVGLKLPNSNFLVELVTFYSPEGSKDPQISSANQIGYRHLAFEVENIEKVVSMLKAKDVHFFSDVHNHKLNDPNSNIENKKVCYFTGPEGIILELAEYELKKK